MVVLVAVLTSVGLGPGLACSLTCPGVAASVSSAAGGGYERRASVLSDRSEVAGAALGNRIYVVGGLTATGVTADVQVNSS